MTSSTPITAGSSLNTSFSQRRSPQLLRDLVFDYLFHYGYMRTAEALQGQPLNRLKSLDEDEDIAELDVLCEGYFPPSFVASVERRKEILSHIRSGRIGEAKRLLDLHFPTVLGPVLDSNTSPSSGLPISSLVSALESSTTLNPAHLTLNLRIHAYVEAFRTVPLSFPAHSTASTPKPLPPPDQTYLLIEGQRIYKEASLLPHPIDRATYIAELGNVGGLLAYTVPENSPMARYLSQERRDAVARQIENAILHRSGLPSVSKIGMLVKHIGVVFRTLHDDKVTLPPGTAALWPKDLNAPVIVPASKKDKEGSLSFEPFSLVKFLGSSESASLLSKKTS